MNSPNHITTSGTPPAERAVKAGGARRLAALLACFDDERRAGKAHRSLERRLRAAGGPVYDTTVLRVDGNHKATVHDPRRVIAGTLTPLLTWGVFGLVTGGISSMVASAVLGALCGGFFAYRDVHHATKSQLAHLGAALPAGSSALLTFTEAEDAQALLADAAQEQASAASVALIDDELNASIATSAGPSHEAPEAEQKMILLRYPDPAAAAKAARAIPDDIEVELVVSTDQAGHTHVSDPRFGSGAIGRSNIWGWGGLGLVCGALAGITGGGGVVGFITSGLVTGIVWGLFGLGAGALFGLWAGRSVSARRLKGLGGLLRAGTSALLAWTDKPLQPEDVAPAGVQRLVLGFAPTDRGAVLAVRGADA